MQACIIDQRSDGAVRQQYVTIAAAHYVAYAPPDNFLLELQHHSVERAGESGLAYLAFGHEDHFGRIGRTVQHRYQPAPGAGHGLAAQPCHGEG